MLINIKFTPFCVVYVHRIVVRSNKYLIRLRQGGDDVGDTGVFHTGQL